MKLKENSNKYSNLCNIEDEDTFYEVIIKLIQSITEETIKNEKKTHDDKINIEINGKIVGDVFFKANNTHMHSPLLIKIFLKGKKEYDILKFIKDFIESKSKNIPDEITRCLIVSQEYLTNITSLNETYNPPNNQNNTYFYVWDCIVINTLGKEKKNLNIEKIVAKNIQDREKNNTLYLQECSSQYHKGKLVLVLGSGISQEANLPDWKTLVQEIYSDMLRKEVWQYIKNPFDLETPIINEEGFSEAPFIYADDIKEFLKDSYPTAIRKHLYKNKSECNLFSIIAELTNLRSIITYNYDDLLEESMVSNCHVIHSGDTGKDNNMMNIYHIHGYIPDSTNTNQVSTDIIFSDDDFYRLLSEQYHWANIVQISHFRKYTCLFLGISLRDPNIRRLLKYHHCENPKHFHYLIKRKLNNDYPPSLDPQVQRYVHEIRHTFIQRSYEKMGIKIVWIERENYFASLSKILEEITENGN